MKKKYPPEVMTGMPKLKYRAWSMILGVLLIVYMGFMFWRDQTHYPCKISGESMEETLHDGDYLYVRKLDLHKPQRGDIIIIKVSAYHDRDGISGDYFIKRLIATEGDAVRCVDSQVQVRYAGEEEFTVLKEDYAKGVTKSFKEVTVGEGEIFFLGDNREISLDSRVLGCYLYSDIVGTVSDFAAQTSWLLTGWLSVVSEVRDFFR